MDDEVARYARLLLERAGVGERLPTPVDDLLACAELVVSKDIDLTEPHHGFIARNYKVLLSALKKAMGMVDLRERVIYLDTTVNAAKQNFVKLHEIGHKVLPWQRDIMLHLDDDSTLSPDVKDLFEAEANRFASEVLFQGERFDRDIRDLPLELRTALQLARLYGGSIHATLRRYVERHPDACMVLVLGTTPLITSSGTHYPVNRRHESIAFTHAFPTWLRPERVPVSADYLQPLAGPKGGAFEEIETDLTLPGLHGPVPCVVHVFKNRFSNFVLLVPLGKRRATRARIVERVGR
ncbi:ImmA/IrrE family metallo-endopeptidase (plasmid) [Deinococcus sp. D7000]|nr:ImmA/IrrE family metallo-endopeptidase [Deinococcus sp. D7000]